MRISSNNVFEKVYYVTGASKGLGLCLVNKLLESGFNVAATSREKKQLEENVDSKYVNGLNFIALQVDLSNEESIKQSIKDTIKKFTRIDVLINNSGYGTLGTIEELTDSVIRKNYDCNVFGVINTIRSALPHMRENKYFLEGPRIINISSIKGFYGGFAAFSVYNSTKFAIEGLTESLSEDLKEFNIHVTTCKPGYFRTNFLHKDTFVGPVSPIQEYTKVREVLGFHENQINDNQKGDPNKGALAIIEMSLLEKPPLHFFLGPDTLILAKKKIESIQNDIQSCLNLSKSTNFDE
ncbi:hypothetical protein RB653_009994 [Dictyostelium firmibasis]|uniref:Uncharacterized protein n=1 Tax=Dictyostelium firmibasis TaxID=79012 RepID=A0AAN7YLP8_9MYCE